MQTPVDVEGLPSAERIDEIHEAIRAFVAERFRGENALALITALTYEVGRIGGIIAAHADLGAADTARMLDGIREVMRQHVDAFRAGKLGDN